MADTRSPSFWCAVSDPVVTRHSDVVPNAHAFVVEAQDVDRVHLGHYVSQSVSCYFPIDRAELERVGLALSAYSLSRKKYA